MKAEKIITSLIIITITSCYNLCIAEPVSTVFTYEGWFMDGNEPAEGIYDLKLILYDNPDPNIGIQIGYINEISDCNVINGLFTADVDFSLGDPNVFNGQKRWLEIGYRDGELNEPNEYMIVIPRYEILPVPYALYAASGTPGPQGPKGDAGEMGPMGPEGPPGDSRWQLSGSDIYYNTGNVGIGITTPMEKLEVAGTVKATGTETGIYGEATTGQFSIGVHGVASDSYGRGVYGEASDDHGNGVYGITSGSQARGVYGYATGDEAQGVRGSATGSSGQGVYGTATGDDGQGVYGRHISSGDYGSLGSKGMGVQGYSEGGYGVYGDSLTGRGVYGHSTNGYGLYGYVIDGIAAVRGLSSGGFAGFFQGPENDGTSAALKIKSGSQEMLLDGNEIDAFGSSLSLNHNSSENITLATGGGNVGVGTTNPREKLVVKVEGTTWGYPHFAIEAYNSTNKWDMTVGGSDNFYLGYNEDTKLVVETDGGVGIGTSSPGAYKLNVAGALKVQGSLSLDQIMFVYGLTGTSSGNNVRLYNNRLYYYSSSKKYKKDIQPLEEDFYKILRVEPKSFIDKASGERNIGFIAEEFDHLGLKNLVNYRDGQPDALKYELISVYLLEVVKDQAKSLKQLQEENESLKRKLQQENESIQQRLVAIEKMVEQVQFASAN